MLCQVELQVTHIIDMQNHKGVWIEGQDRGAMCGQRMRSAHVLGYPVESSRLLPSNQCVFQLRNGQLQVPHIMDLHNQSGAWAD